MVLSGFIAVVSPSTVSAAGYTWSACGSGDGTVSIASGESVALNLTGCTAFGSVPALAKWSTGADVTGSNVNKFTVGEDTYQSFAFADISTNANYPEVSFTSSTYDNATAYITTCEDTNRRGTCASGETSTTLTVTVYGGTGGGGGGSSSSSGTPATPVPALPLFGLLTLGGLLGLFGLRKLKK